MYKKTPDLTRMPVDATHWAPENADFQESWYKLEGECWFGCNTYWAEQHIPTRWYGYGLKPQRSLNDMIKLPKLANAPEGATHWAPDSDGWAESWYRLEDGLWYCINDYWASDIAERPYGMAAKSWKEDGAEKLIRPLEELAKLK